MLPFLSLAILALAVSLDGFGVGVMYGLRKIRIPLVSIAIISVCSGLVIFTSMQIGAFAAKFLSPAVAKSTGAVILIGIGVWAIVQMWRQRPDNGSSDDADTGPGGAAAGQSAAASDTRTGLAAPTGGIRTVLRIELKRLGLVIEILRTPSLADVDRSGYISSSEAVLLGVALSLDAFGAGIGAAFIGFAPLVTAAVIALSSGLFIATGLRVGLTYADTRWLQRLAVLPGCILIAMGIMKLM
ncbi:sporulation membrane protein YtaF [Paenibacillus hemerocallicola]|jgi:putative Mn2+ efflux pump MntP|uniref:Sporulation membrane protein YtaF n=1 Tax=Paenibacillus hemerocallicola TaxID=1172614 RepID=A0A5C4SYH4_9BACL|nr:MntP/YtaF family protein [Paenibacillus hemerocallicola]TNJ61832.1 sporulation membrane protein YtaF [Paenibacillus hemerocallicola]